MNDEPDTGPSSSRTQHHEDAQDEIAALTPAQMKERQKINRQTFNRKRALFLDDLLNSLDYLVYAELSAIYYMDCSFLRFTFRSLIQFVLLTPKNDSYPRPPEPQPYVGAILGTNLICIILHSWLSAPTGSEATRGYLQGGLAMDFIGQKGPSSKFVLVLLDLLVVVLQLVHLSAHVARNRLRDLPKTSSSTAANPAPPQPTIQDLDSEERGVRRSDDLIASEAQRDIELQPLNPSGTTTSTAPPQGPPSSNPTSSSTPDSNFSPSADALIFDAFYSGQIVLGDFDIWRTLKEQFWNYQNASPEARGGTYRAQLAGRLMGLRLAGGRLGGLRG